MLDTDVDASTRSRSHPDVGAPGDRGEEAALVAVPLPRSAPSAGPVVVGADGSLGGERALRFAAEHADRLGADLFVVTAENSGRAAVPEIVEDALVAQLAACRAAHPRVTIRLRVVEVGAGQALLRAARRAQLVAVGTQRRHGAARPPLGATGWDLLQACSCPVVVVPPGAFADPGSRIAAHETDGGTVAPAATVLASGWRDR
ncbi:universal stress protein [Actinomycetospora chibensis]|uniref:Universal stress protein n=1 Tax=Actinomycetospora chibensis TaxID=663606 RepID=A0ABV9RQC8_9PSEU|nr:universal stress protein [Actinomycetospora chibensis]MDD7923223.1 universal stress protein [Actinomycetospora chibensis]